MAELYLHQRRIGNVFSLLGAKENSITASIGWALARSPTFLRAFLKQVVPDWTGNPELLTVSLQEFARNSGITDIEVVSHELHLIVEAKRGWQLPSQGQLQKYLPRFAGSGDKVKRIITLSECSKQYAREYLLSELAGIPIRHLAWHNLAVLCSSSAGSHAEKRLLAELKSYLATIVNMQKQDSNWVYVVSLSRSEWAPNLNFIQVVNERKRYFHPYGRSGWPKQAPNYFGFRYDGCLQSIHHVEAAEVIRNFHLHFPESPDRDNIPHLLYRLGPAICPAQKIETGAIYPSGRVWAMFDLLLTSKTISAARDASKKRGAEMVGE